MILVALSALGVGRLGCWALPFADFGSRFQRWLIEVFGF
jgi:hypothetical protein